MKDRGTRQCWLVAVLAIGFLRPIVVSVGSVLGWIQLHPATPRRFLFAIFFQIAGLVTLYFALRDQGRKVKDIGLVIEPRLMEIGRAMGLFVGVYVLRIVLYSVYAFLNPLVPWLQGLGPHRNFDPAVLFGSSVSLLPLLYAITNPFHEELLVRAFLITEVEGLYQSTVLAVIVSVALQTSYHLYQGLPLALSHIPTFLVFSLYYVRARRIFPVILAHLFMDISALAVYASHHW
jgi:membrane protease YdiL (CAAX protease family)